MPFISVRTALGASSTATPLAGSQYEYLPFDAFVEFGIVADANGVLASVFSGSDVLMEEGPVILGSAINIAPRYPDDYQLQDEAVAGDRLSVRLRDTSAAARVVMTGVKITPV